MNLDSPLLDIVRIGPSLNHTSFFGRPGLLMNEDTGDRAETGKQCIHLDTRAL